MMDNQKNSKLGGQSAGNILVVDDNPQNLRLLIAILSANGYKVRPALSGKIALESALSTLPELILLDIMMPEMDGYQVCFELKANELTKNVPIIFISAIDAISDKVKAFEKGAVDYITKPFHTEEVLARVNTHIALRRTQKMLEDEIELRKVSEEKLKEISLKYQQMANQDYLTGLNNRRYFMERAQEELNRSQRYRHPLVLLMIDIDHFKSINDNFGHHSGDIVLKTVAMIFLDTLRSNDLIGRIGGEEFAAVLPETIIEDAIVVAERVRKNIEQSALVVEEKTIKCTVSIGISCLKELNNSLEGSKEQQKSCDIQTLDQLIKKADEALYLAKSSGRNCIR